MSKINSKVGPKTKASKGEKKYKALSITLPPELWDAAMTWKEKDETKSAFIARLIEYAINDDNFVLKNSDFEYWLKKVD